MLTNASKRENGLGKLDEDEDSILMMGWNRK